RARSCVRARSPPACDAPSRPPAARACGNARRDAARAQSDALRLVSSAWHLPNVMDDSSKYETFANLATEQRNPATRDLDRLDVPGILARISAEDCRVPDAVAREVPYIARAVELVVTSFREGGRLIYVGAGTSGRLGVLDASECPPTFGSDPEQVQGVMAGGPGAPVRAIEGADAPPQQA